MNARCDQSKWTAIVLAAGRGSGDPLASHFGVSHKCLLPVGGVAMLKRVVAALNQHPRIGEILVSIEDEALLPQALGELADVVSYTASHASAAQSAGAALRGLTGSYPVLLTTADHALLDQAMLDHFIKTSEQSDSDLTVGLASEQTILAEYPNARRTFLGLGPDRVSGCNLYGIRSPKALKAIDLWQTVEANRKNPLAIVKAFGLNALVRYLTRTINLQSAFALASRRLGITAKPVLMPFANAAVDIDKPEDHELVEQILGN